MGKKILGLEIHSDAVSAALVASSLKGARLESAVRIPFQEGESTEDALHRCLEMIHQSMDISSAVCVTAIPSTDVYFRNLYLPFSDERKIRQILPFEIEPILPAPIEDVVVDFQTVSLNGKQGLQQVLSAAVDRPRVKAFLDVLAAHQLDPEIVTVGGCSEAVCLSGLSQMPDAWFFISAGEKETTVTAVSSGEILLVKSVKSDPDRSDTMDALCRRMEHVRLFCEGLLHRRFAPEAVYWTGAVSDREDFERRLSRHFQCPAEKIDLMKLPDLKWAPFSGPAPAFPNDGVDGALALALVELTGSKVLNFRRGPFAFRQQWLEYKGHFLRTGALLLLVLCLGFFQLYAETRALDREVAQMNQETRAIFSGAFPDVGRIVDPVQQMRVKIEEVNKQLGLAGSPETQARKIDLLLALSSRVPSAVDVEITRLVIGPDSMSISGNTSTFNAVDEMKSALEKDPLFQTVTINSANLEKSGERVNFKIRIDL